MHWLRPMCRSVPRQNSFNAHKNTSSTGDIEVKPVVGFFGVLTVLRSSSSISSPPQPD